MKLKGLHHVTAIAGDPQRNLDFYAGALGLRLVKRTINFDDPGSYHFYFGDAKGSPGTILTFFPWPHARPGRRGVGETEATALAVPEDSLGYWSDRLKAQGVNVQGTETRFDERLLRLADPDGMLLELVATPDAKDVAPWTAGGVPEEHAIRGLHAVTLGLDECAATAQLLTEHLGYRLILEKENRQRYATADPTAPGSLIDLVQLPGSSPGQSGAGSVHHIAFRAEDDAEQLILQRELSKHGLGVSPVMDRSYFHSIYFREPGGVLFEIATDAPGFATDETPDALGRNLRLPSWMEASRERIETILPAVNFAIASGQSA